MLTDPISITMLILGIMIHQLLTMAKETKAQGKVVKLREHYKAHPYSSAATILLSIAGYFMLGSLGQLSHITALGIGYMGDSVGNTVTQLTKTAINVSPPT